MKQWLILIVSLIVLILSGIWEINYLKNSSIYALSDLEYSRNLVENGNFTLANEQINSIDDSWKNIKTVWSIFIDHEEIGNIDERILDYKTCIELKDKDEAIKAAKELERIFKHVVEKQEIRVGNII